MSKSFKLFINNGFKIGGDDRDIEKIITRRS